MSKKQKYFSNLLFLTGQIKCEPYGDYIGNIHRYWKNDFKKLEAHHGYIQWLFPSFEQGANELANPLSDEELILMKNKEHAEIVQSSILNSYEMMLNFYGIKLVDPSGKLERTLHWKEGYENLIRNRHNCARITRIIECLGLFDLNGHQTKFVDFLFHEVCETHNLAVLYKSLDYFWIDMLKDDEKAKALKQGLEKFKTLFEDSRSRKNSNVKEKRWCKIT